MSKTYTIRSKSKTGLLVIAALLEMVFGPQAHSAGTFDPSQGVMLRVFKQAAGADPNYTSGDSQKYPDGVMGNWNRAKLEAWVWSRSAGRYELYKTFDVPFYSGLIGPKVRKGDDQVPEGFYNISGLNDQSKYGKYALKVDYPNAHDRAKGWSGGDIEIHGDVKSSGCLPLDGNNKEVYSLAQAAMQGGHSVPLQIFPFPMTEENMSKVRGNRWAGFWNDLKEGYDAFESTHMPPKVSTSGGNYQVSAQGVPVKQHTTNLFARQSSPRQRDLWLDIDSAGKSAGKKVAPVQDPAQGLTPFLGNSFSDSDAFHSAVDQSDLCSNALAAYFGDSGNQKKLRDYLKIQSQLTLHRVAWAYLKLLGAQGGTVRPIEQVIRDLLSQRDSEVHQKFIDSRSKKVSKKTTISHNRLLLNGLETLAQVTARTPNLGADSDPYLLKFSDLKMVDLLVATEEAYGSGKKNGLIDFLNMVNSSYRGRIENSENDIHVAESQIQNLVAEKQKIANGIEQYLAKHGCDRADAIAMCPIDGSMEDTSRGFSAMLEDSQYIQEKLFGVLRQNKEEVLESNRWGNYWLRVGEQDTPAATSQ